MENLFIQAHIFLQKDCTRELKSQQQERIVYISVLRSAVQIGSRATRLFPLCLCAYWLPSWHYHQIHINIWEWRLTPIYHPLREPQSFSWAICTLFTRTSDIVTLLATLESTVINVHFPLSAASPLLGCKGMYCILLLDTWTKYCQREQHSFHPSLTLWWVDITEFHMSFFCFYPFMVM